MVSTRRLSLADHLEQITNHAPSRKLDWRHHHRARAVAEARHRDRGCRARRDWRLRGSGTAHPHTSGTAAHGIYWHSFDLGSLPRAGTGIRVGRGHSRHGRFAELGPNRQAGRSGRDPNGTELLSLNGNEAGKDGGEEPIIQRCFSHQTSA